MFEEIDWKMTGIALIPFTTGQIMARADSTMVEVFVAIVGAVVFYGVAKWWGIWDED